MPHVLHTIWIDSHEPTNPDTLWIKPIKEGAYAIYVYGVKGWTMITAEFKGTIGELIVSQLPEATPESNGVMSAEDKTKLDAIGIYYGSTEYWEEQKYFVPPAGTIVVYTDYETIMIDDEATTFPGIKIGNGNAYVQELAFVNGGLREDLLKHINEAISDFVTTDSLNTALAEKQNNISDLSEIREGVAAGKTAYQKPSTGIPSADMTEAVRTSLAKADSALQEHQRLKTINGESILGEGDLQLSEPVQSDWDEDDSTDLAYIKNKPTIPTVPDISADIEADGSSDTKTASPKAVKTFVEGKGYYTKPQTGIPKTDLESAVQTSLGKADTAIQNVKTINGQSVVGTGDLTVSRVAPDLVPTVSDVEFTKKDTGVNATMAKVKEVKGKSLVWNQLVNPQTSGSETKQGITCVRSNGLFTMNGTRDGTGNASFLILPSGGELKFISGHKYLLKGCYPGGSDTTYRIWLQSSTAFPVGNRLDDTGAGIIMTALADETLGQGYFFIQMQGSSTFTFTDAVFAPQIFDLTKLFGSNNEPSTVEEFESLYSLDYYAYNVGDIVNNKVQSIITRNSEGIQIDKVNINVTSITGKASGSNSSEIIFPNGMKSAGIAYDSLVIDNDGWCRKAIKRIGVVDLGTLTYEFRGNQTFLANLSGAKDGSSSQQMSNCLCTKYETHAPYQVYNHAIGISLGSPGVSVGGKVQVYDPAYTDAATFKTAMSGVILYYELATPEEYTSDVPIFLGAYKIDPNGTEERTPIDTESAVTAPFSGSIQYGLTTSEALNVDKRGLQKDLIAGQALSLQGTEVTQVEGISTVAKSTGLARIKEVKGKSLVWNQMVNGVTWRDISDPTGDYTNGAFTADRANSGAKFSFTEGAYPFLCATVYKASHKYLISCELKSTSTLVVIGIMGNSATSPSTAYYKGSAGTGSFERISFIIDGTESSNYYALAILDKRTSDWDEVAFRNPMVVDLTKMFGSGNEPSTVEEFEAMFPLDYYAYNPGEIISNNTEKLEITGLNQWDGEYSESGLTYLKSDGTIVASSSYKVSSYIPVIPGTSYYLKDMVASNADAPGLCWYDSEKNYISGVNSNIYLYNKVIVAPAGACFMRCSVYQNTVDTACVSVSGSRDGQYEPYQKSGFALDLPTLTGKLNGEGESVTIFPDGMRSAGTAHDSLVVDEDGWCRKAVVNTHKIILNGTEAYTIATDNYIKSDATDVYIEYGNIPNTVVSTRGNVYCTHLLSSIGTIWNQVGFPDQIAINATAALHQIHLNISNNRTGVVYGTDAKTEAKNKVVAWITAQYNAGTPVTIVVWRNPLEYVLDTPIYMGIKTQQGGVIRQLPENGSAPTTSPMRMDITYALPPEALMSEGSIRNMLEALKSAGIINTYTMAWDYTIGKWTFSFT